VTIIISSYYYKAFQKNYVVAYYKLHNFFKSNCVFFTNWFVSLFCT